MRHALILVMAAMAVLTGCSKDPVTQTSVPDTPDTYPMPAPSSAMPGPGGAPNGGQAAPALAQLQQAWNQVRTLSATYDLYEKGAKGLETANVKFYFRKPGDYRYEVAKHTSSIKNGSTSVFNTRTRQIKSRLGGALSFVPISGTLDDERSKSIRDYTLDQTDYATQTELFLKPGAQVTQRGPGVLELARPVMYPGVDALRVTLDAQRGLPVSFELVQGAQVVYRKRISGLQVNPSLTSSKFSL